MSFQYLSIDKTGQDGNIYVITMNKPPENRLNIDACQELIRAFRAVVSASLVSIKPFMSAITTHKSLLHQTTPLTIPFRSPN